MINDIIKFPENTIVSNDNTEKEILTVWHLPDETIIVYAGSGDKKLSV